MSLRLDSRASRHLYPQLMPGTRVIRLLQIMPGDFSILPIHCWLIEKDLDSAPPYKALSYTWGDDSVVPDVTIFCNAKPLKVSANLHAALRRLREPRDIASVWVDALCINQEDAAERTHQVGIMRDIYKNSAKVLIWLGEVRQNDWIWDEKSAGRVGGDFNTNYSASDGASDADGDADATLTRDSTVHANIVRWYGDNRDIPMMQAYFAVMQNEEREFQHEGNTCDIFGAFCILHLLANGVPVDKIWHLRHVRYSSGMVRGLNAIMERNWWRRIWVVQETVVAKGPIVYYGHLCAPWRMFALAAMAYDTGRMKVKTDGVSSSLNSSQSLLQFTRVIMEIDSTRRSWEIGDPMVPLTLLRKFRSRLATDPRDKVFAVLGLIRTWGTESSGEAIKGVVPDYTIPADQLFCQTTELLIKNRRSLAVLAGTLQGRHVGNIYSMPSWVADWNCRPSVNEHVRLGNYHLYNAADYLGGSVAIHGQSILKAQGCIIDTVKHVGRVLEAAEGRNRARLVILEWQKFMSNVSSRETKYIGGGTIYAAFWRTLCSDLGIVQRGKDSSSVREFYRLPEHIVENKWYESWLTLDEQPQRRTSLIGGLWVEPAASTFEEKRKNEFQFVLECASGDRRFFWTSKGYIGTGPPDTKVGDSVAVLLGSRVPFILRDHSHHVSIKCSGDPIRVLFSGQSSYWAGKDAKVHEDTTICCYESHQRCYRVIGDAYVHGIMTAEAKSTAEWYVEPIYMV